MKIGDEYVQAGDPEIEEAFVRICLWWKTGRAFRKLGDVDRLRAVSISIGLGDLFDNNRAAEMQWLTAPHVKLKNVSPMDHMIRQGADGVRAVENLVEQARQLR